MGGKGARKGLLACVEMSVCVWWRVHVIPL